MSTLKIVVLDGYTLNPGDIDWSPLQALGECTIYDRTPESHVLERAQGAHILLTNKTVLNASQLEQLPELKYIGVLATGYNVVDIDQAAKQKIVVTNVPGYSAPAVAQAVFSMILTLTNRVELHDRSVKKGDWAACEDFCYQKSPLTELKDKTLGIVGYGSIGKQVAKIGKAFEMNILVHTRTIPENNPLNLQFVSLDELLASSDIITLHCPLTSDNEEMINQQSLSQMKKNCYLINTSRGPLINENALAAALSSGVIQGAALDVLAVEPPDDDNPLFAIENCLITPHIAWATIEARTRLLDIAVNNLQSFIDGTPVNQVN